MEALKKAQDEKEKSERETERSETDPPYVADLANIDDIEFEAYTLSSPSDAVSRPDNEHEPLAEKDSAKGVQVAPPKNSFDTEFELTDFDEPLEDAPVPVMNVDRSTGPLDFSLEPQLEFSRSEENTGDSINEAPAKADISLSSDLNGGNGIVSDSNHQKLSSESIVADVEQPLEHQAKEKQDSTARRLAIQEAVLSDYNSEANDSGATSDMQNESTSDARLANTAPLPPKQSDAAIASEYQPVEKTAVEVKEDITLKRDAPKRPGSQSVPGASSNDTQARGNTAHEMPTQPSPVKAARVLGAGVRPTSGHRRRNYLIAGMIVVLFCLGYGSYVYYEQQNFTTPLIAKATLTSRGEITTNEEPVIPPKLDEASNSASDMLQSSSVTLDTVAPPAAQNSAETSGDNISAASSTESPSNTLALSRPPVQSASQKVKTPAVEPKPNRPEKADRQGGENVRIVKSETVDPLDRLIRHAYDAFQLGDTMKAKRLYSQALNRDAMNRDTLIGLAAIAVREGNYDNARGLYNRLLNLNNNDSAALAGLLSILGDSNPLAAVSELKHLIAREPNSAHLHFILGTLYIDQKNWADAEQAFFKAYSSDRQNADYAYNLAVSLDHLGQRKTAVHFYEEALVHASTQPIEFTKADVSRRIRVLKTPVGMQ